MEIGETRDAILGLEPILSERMKSNIHYYSIKNFVMHFDEIKSEIAKRNICLLLSQYLDEIKSNEYDFYGIERLQLARKYLSQLSGYYREYSGFVGLIKIKLILLIGIVGDGLLYFANISKHIGYVPIVTIAMLLYYFFIVVFKKPKGRVYGIFY
jgi:hypothetical protein